MLPLDFQAIARWFGNSLRHGPSKVQRRPVTSPILELLRKIAYNLLWSWNPEAVALPPARQRPLNPAGTTRFRCRLIDQKRPVAAADDVVAHLDRVATSWTNMWPRDQLVPSHAPRCGACVVAYFFAEFD
jgi:hypothetical protein